MRTSTRRSRPERREQIAGAALRLLGEGGLDAVTSVALARRVRLTPGALFRHFETLDRIVGAAVERAALRLESGFPDDGVPAVEWLGTLARERVALLRAEPGIAWLLRSEQAPAALPAPALTRLREAVRRSRARIDAAIRRGVAEGDLRRDVDPRVLLVMFTATVHALAGPPGLSHRAVGRSDPDAVLSGLFVLLGNPRTESRR